MSTFGRRGSRDSGWNWSRPPAGPGRPPPPLPLLPLAGAALLFAAIAAALLTLWLSDSGSSSPPPVTVTPTATATHTPSPTTVPTPTPSPTPTPNAGPALSLAVWNGQSWRLEGEPIGGSFHEGESIPFRLRIGGARASDSYGITLRYTCRTLQFLSDYRRDSGAAPALAKGGPLTAVPDSTVALPDDPATPADDGQGGRLSLWGGSFGPLKLVAPTTPCSDGRMLNVSLHAGRDTLFLLWSAVVAPGAADRGLPVRVSVLTPQGERRIEIDPASILPAP